MIDNCPQDWCPTVEPALRFLQQAWHALVFGELQGPVPLPEREAEVYRVVERDRKRAELWLAVELLDKSRDLDEMLMRARGRSPGALALAHILLEQVRFG